MAGLFAAENPVANPRMSEPKRIRWWPAALILGSAGLAFVVIRQIDVWPYEQARTFALLATAAFAILALLSWWVFFSRASLHARLGVLAAFALPLALFRHRGMTGDFLPIFEFRFGKKSIAPALRELQASASAGIGFTEFLGPKRDGRIDDVKLDPRWENHPPEILWKKPIGAAWSGFAMSETFAVTQEQHGEVEWVSCYELGTGELLWKNANPGKYNNAIAGEGPRATPTIIPAIGPHSRPSTVLTLGATGILRSHDLVTGSVLWTRNIAEDAAVAVPEWGFASSPLVHKGLVIVSAGGSGGKSLLAYHLMGGTPAWSAGDRPANYSSPFLLTLAGRDQIVMFNTQAITAHDPATGAVLWEHPWGKGMPHVARPIPVGENRVLFSSGYGVGSALLEISTGHDGKLAASEVWKTVRFQAKFSNPVERGGCVYGVSDGIFACLDLRDGSVKWKSGRYGHGQGLLVGEHFLQMTETPGVLVLLRPTPEGPNELARFHVFDAKTWNPIALSGDLLLVRNDIEAACIRLPLAK